MNINYYLFSCNVDTGAGEKSVSFVTIGFPTMTEIEQIANKKLYGDLNISFVKVSIQNFIEINESQYNQLKK